jgi:hypothetical protein
MMAWENPKRVDLIPRQVGDYTSRNSIERQLLREIKAARRPRETLYNAAWRLGYRPIGETPQIPENVREIFHAFALSERGFYAELMERDGLCVYIRQREGAFKRIVRYLRKLRPRVIR